jgi:O-antigen/teichoic acid export membrane protein
MLSSKIIKEGTLLFISTMIGNIASYFFQFFMSRKLSIEDFGVFNSLMSLFIITAVPIGTLLTIIARYTSQFKAKGEYEKIHIMYKSAGSKIALIGIICVMAFIFLSGNIMTFLNLSARVPIIIVGLMLAVNFVLTLNLGVLQGLQRFWFLGVNMGLNGVIRLIMGIVFVYLGFKVNGALGATLLAGAVVFMITIIPLRKFLLDPAKGNIINGSSYKDVFSESMPVMLTYLSFAILTNIDLILVKHFFTPEDAGNYAAVAILGRTVLYLPGAIAIAMFPMVAENHALNKNSHSLLKNALLFSAAISGIGMALFIVIPEFILTISMGGKYAPVSDLLRLFGIAMFPFSMMNIMINFNLARRRVKFLYTLIFACALQIMLISFFHSTLVEVLLIMMGVGVILFIMNGLILFKEERDAVRIVAQADI